LNSFVVVATFVVLAASPAPVHFPSTHWEAVLLTCAAVVLLLGSLLLAGAAAARTIERGRSARTETSEIYALQHLVHFEVMAEDGIIGIVDEVLANRNGIGEVLVVTDGWFGARRFYIPVGEMSSSDATSRTLCLRGAGAKPNSAG
jgi:hypothetical protein